MGLSRAWVEKEIQEIREDERDKARIALIVAKSSYQIDDGAIEKVVQQGLSEADLVKLGAWGALLGAKTISNWCAR
jgi:cytochrome c553